MINLGLVPRLEGDPDGARSMLQAGPQISRRSGNWSGLAYACSSPACLAADLDDWHRAAMLHDAAQALLDRTGQGREQGEARLRQDCLDQVRAHLGQDQFNRVYAKGTTLSLEQALDTARTEHRLCAGCDHQGKYPRTAPNGGYFARTCRGFRLLSVTAFRRLPSLTARIPRRMRTFSEQG